MDKLTKIILAFAVAFLAVLIGIGIGNRSAQKKIKPFSPPLPVVSEKVKVTEKDVEIKAIQEKPSARETERIEFRKEKTSEGIYIPREKRVSPPPYPPGMETYPPEEDSSFYPGL